MGNGYAIIDQDVVIKLYKWPNSYLWMYGYDGVPMEVKEIAELQDKEAQRAGSKVP